MTPSTSKSAYWAGFRGGLPFVLVVGPFGLLFGVVATEAGMNILEVLSMSVLIIAGAAQFTALALLVENSPTVIIVLSALAVNMRMAMYSAALVPHLGPAPLLTRALAAYFLVDQAYAVSAKAFEEDPSLPLQRKVAFFFGAVSPVAPMWYLFTFLGAWIGETIPPAFALDFAVPITFIALTGPMLRTPAHVVAAIVSIGVALLLAFLPYNLWLMVAAVAAMMAGARVELWLARQRA